MATQTRQTKPKIPTEPKPTDKNSRMFRAAAGEFVFCRDGDGGQDDRVVELSFSSEEPYARWFGTEILSHDEGAIDLSRLQEIGVLLFNHDSYAAIGQILSAEMDQQTRKCKAAVRFDTDEYSEMIYQKVLSGTLKGVSVGYRVSNWEEVENGAMSANGRFQGPCSLAVKWMPYEVSIVSVPADATVGVGRSYEDPAEPGENGGYKKMPEKNKDQEPATRNTEPVVNQPPAENVDQAVTRALGAERQRVGEITSMCRSFEIEPDEFITGGKTVEETRTAVLERLAKDRKPSTVTITADEVDKFRTAATDGLAMRAGIAIEKPADGANEFRGKRMIRLAAECIEREKGTGTRGYTDEDLVREALTGTGAFPGILSNVAHKSMAQAYQTSPTTFQLWTASGSNTDFKQATRYRLSEADELVKMTETGEFKHAEVKEASVTAAIATYGRSFSITRQAIINDDMGALSQIPARYGAAARRGINKMVYEILTSNPTIEGANLFSNNHNNLASGVIAIAGLGAAKAMMARQSNIKGKEKLNVQPAFLIVPPELEVTAAQLISSVVDPTKSNATPNPFANRLTVVADPELTNTSEWYLAAAAGVLPTIEVTYLNGKEAPTMESAVQFDTLGIKWRVYLDAGVNLIDYRGLLKSSGV